MTHRGPDDSGTYLAGNVGLAHTRLAILDLTARGRQPMSAPESDIQIVFNGEIYNFRKLRRELESRGHVFRSQCDTEVILHSYLEWGSDCLARFNGMFAFAIYNPNSGELFLARDRLGIKPLYYYLDKSQIVFASELKTILKDPEVDRQIDRDHLPELFAFRYLAKGQTMLKNIQQLEPGHYAIIDRGTARFVRYWDVCNGDPVIDRTTPGEWLDGFESLLASSVESRLIADVSVGCALSGGIDSSLVTALAVEQGGSSMECFTIGFEDPVADERPYARAIAEKLCIRNHSTTLSQADFWGQHAALTWYMDEPINHPNSVGIWLLAKLAKERVTVLLTGEGGDELLGGYDRFRSVARMRRRQRMPFVKWLARHIPDSLPGARWGRLRELAEDPDRLLIWSSSYLSRDHIELLFGKEGVERAEAARRSILQSSPLGDSLNQHLYYELKTYLPSLLTRVDKMCMAVSLENRVPLLDHRLVEYAFAMPTDLKVNSKQGKIVLRELAGERFGYERFDRRKKGFGVPERYFRGPGLGHVKDLVESDSFVERSLVDDNRITALLSAYEEGQNMAPDSIWILASFELWARTFIDQPGIRIE